MLVLCAFLLIGNHPGPVMQYKDLIQHTAREYCIPPDLLASVIWIESMGDSQRRGWLGEAGLMQILPKDNEIAPQFTQSWSYSVEELLDPELNIDYGARRLRQVFRQTDSWLMTLAYYNCGKEWTDLGKCGRYGGYNYANRVIVHWRQSLPPPFDCIGTKMC